ncbi:MAG: T9SS type A sorting domain-containing protein [Candidatus Izemoplasmatales bacterium]
MATNVIAQTKKNIPIISECEKLPEHVIEFVDNKINSYNGNIHELNYRIRYFLIGDGIFEIVNMNNMNGYYVNAKNEEVFTLSDLKNKYKNYNINELKNINIKLGKNIKGKQNLHFHIGQFYKYTNYSVVKDEISKDYDAENFGNYLGYNIFVYENVNNYHFESHYFCDAQDPICYEINGINYCCRTVEDIQITSSQPPYDNKIYVSTKVPDYNNLCFDEVWGECTEEVPDNVNCVKGYYTLHMDGHPPFLLHSGNPDLCDAEADVYSFDYGEDVYLKGEMGNFDNHCEDLGFLIKFYLKVESIDDPGETYEKEFLSHDESSDILNGVFNLSDFCNQNGITLDEGKYKVTLGAYDCANFSNLYGEDYGEEQFHAYRSLNPKYLYIIDCPYSRNITENIYGLYLTQAESYIEANNHIETSEKVLYKAGDYIKLKSGFNVKLNNNGKFRALIEPCGFGCNDANVLSASPGIDNPTIDLTKQNKKFSEDFDNKNSDAVSSEFNNDKETIVFPNPFNNKIQIISPYENIYIKVYDISGHYIFNKNYLSKKIELDLSDLKSGTYFLKIISKDETVVKKIIKM